MSKISAMMDIGKRSMMGSQTALQTVSHNIANKSTEGYSRQRVEMTSNQPVGNGKLRIGMGSKTANVSRVSNSHLEKQLLKEGAELGHSEARSQALSRVEEVYNEQLNKGLNKYIGDFFNAFRELSASPENLANRTLVKETAVNLTKDFSRVSDQLKEIKKDINTQIKSEVYKVNEMVKEIATLNEKIQNVEVAGATANDERDRQNLLLKKLSEKVNIRWSEGDNGMVSVMAGNTAMLVSGYHSAELVAKEVPNTETREGETLQIFFKQNETLPLADVTEQIDGGAIGAILEVREKDIGGHLKEVDEMAHSLATKVNNAHRQGYDRYGQKGVNLFTLEGEFDAAAKIDVNQLVKADVGKVSSAATANAPGDNRTANVIANLQYQNVMGGGKSTFDQFYNGMVGKAGVAADQANNRAASQGNIVKQLTNLRESISGVSLDEETTKMIEFQKTFDASARLIRTADEMLETVLNLKR